MIRPDPPSLPQRSHWDVLVVGGGPAGATAARLLARAGHDVLLLDRHAFPRDKVCGDGLIADAQRALHRAGLLNAVKQAAYPASSVEVYSPARLNFTVAGEFLCLRRRRLDALLMSAAEQAGATRGVGEVAAVEPGPGGVVARIHGVERTVTARVMVLATGADVRLLDQCGLVRRTRPSAAAARCYLQSTMQLDRLVVSFDRSIIPGYAWIFPVAPGEYNIGCGFSYRGGAKAPANLRAMFETFVERFPPARELLAAGRITSKLQGGRLRCGLAGARVWDGHAVVAIGESIGSTFAFTGEGIGKAIETAEIAAGYIHQALVSRRPDGLAGLEDEMRLRLGPRYQGYQVAEDWLSRGWVSDLVARRVRRSPRLRGAVADILNETTDPRAVFSLRGLVGSLVH